LVRITEMPKIPGVSYYKKKYDNFAGVDFSTDGSTVADKRSPDALNMISDSGGYPVKRCGWRILHTTALNGETTEDIETPVYAIYYFDDTEFVIHAGTKLYSMKSTGCTVIKSSVNNGKGDAFLYDDVLYILTGTEYLSYDGTTIQAVDGYVPLITIAATPATGSGTYYQDLNMLTPKRKISYTITEQTVSFKLGVTDISSVDEVKLNDVVKTVDTDYTVNLSQGAVLFVSGGGEILPTTGDSLVITFSKNVENKISKCTFATIYNNHVFFGGTADYPSTDFYSELNDPTYVPDTSYTTIGSDDAAIMGYLHINDALAIVKAENQQDAAVFLRTYDYDSTDVLFPITQGLTGDGAISKGVFCRLIDDPIFLTRNGVYAIGSEYIKSERVMQSRSSFVNPKLTLETLANAIATIWNGYLVLCVNDQAFIADSRQRSYTNNITGTFEYEWYYFDNIPASCLFENDGELYFGTADGKICKFNTDLIDSNGNTLMSAYSDGGYYTGETWTDGEAITAYWTTPVSDDNSFMTYKTMQKKGCGAFLKTYAASSVNTYIITDKDFGTLIKSDYLGLLDFGYIDFEHFIFSSLPKNIVSFGKKIKKYKTIQIKLENDQLNQGFGVFAIERRFIYGSSVK